MSVPKKMKYKFRFKPGDYLKNEDSDSCGIVKITSLTSTDSEYFEGIVIQNCHYWNIGVGQIAEDFKKDYPWIEVKYFKSPLYKALTEKANE